MDLITFDLDETLIHARKCHWLAFNDAFEKIGLKNLSFKKFEPLLNGIRSREVAKSVHPEMSNDELEAVVLEHHKLVEKKYWKLAKPIKGVINALKKLKKKYEIGVVSNCSHTEIYSLLKGAKIDSKIFNVIVGKDDVKYSKPYPDEIFLAEKLTHHNAVYHVGDSKLDIIAGRKAGVKAIAVLTGVNSRKVLEKEMPYAILRSATELPKLLKAK